MEPRRAKGVSSMFLSPPRRQPICWRARETEVREWHDARKMNYPRSTLVKWDASFGKLEGPAQPGWGAAESGKPVN